MQKISEPASGKFFILLHMWRQSIVHTPAPYEQKGERGMIPNKGKLTSLTEQQLNPVTHMTNINDQVFTPFPSLCQLQIMQSY